MIFDALKYFALLRADEHTDEQTLKLKYREQAKFWHPDHNKSPHALENFQKLSKAYNVLKDEKLKTIYMLLSMIYTDKDFPSIERLNTYKSAQGVETPYLRVFAIQKIEKGKIKIENLIGTYDDALVFLRKNAIGNSLKGLFNPKFYKTLKHNIDELKSNSKENLKVLVHNAAAFFDENKLNEAYLSALQALEYATPEQKNVLENFMRKLPKVPYAPQKFESKKLRAAQLKPFFDLLKICFGAAVCLGVFWGIRFFAGRSGDEKINYYQTVEFEGGGMMADDMVANKIVNVPVDKTSTKTLYHLAKKQKVMYGPSEKFDVLREIPEGQTVRLTGYTADKLWLRVMLDDGQTGFVKSKYVKKGVGNAISETSQIIEHEKED